MGYLLENSEHIHSVHFNLATEERLDARQLLEKNIFRVLHEQLRNLRQPRKYGLINSRFYHPGLYFDQTRLKSLSAALENLLQTSSINGIVYSDPYFLRAFAGCAPEIAARLEAIPSVNCMFDDFDRIDSHLRLIADTGFMQPSKIVLDRSLNRKPHTLRDTIARCRRHFPELKFSLLANEGCLFRCPFKFSHDSHIALANMADDPQGTFRINSELGCISYLDSHPAEIFKSPFIRPEDLHHYETHIDIIKLCGRTLGPAFLKKCISAYIRRRHDGNLLDLFDTLEWLAPRIFIGNSTIPPDFHTRVTTCDKTCRDCDYCRELLDKISRKKPMKIKTLLQ